jgi:hypothetical protein
MTDMNHTHAARIAFHLEGLLTGINPADPKPVADAIANAVATAYHDADSTHDQRVAFALAVMAGAKAALQQVEAETGGLVDEVIKAKGRGIGRLLDIRKAAERADISLHVAARDYRLAAGPMCLTSFDA